MMFRLSPRLVAGTLGAFALSLPLAVVGCGATQSRTGVQDEGPDRIAAPGVLMAVEGLGCPMCAESIYVLLKDVEGVADSKVNLDTGTVDVTFQPGAEVSRRALAKAVTDGGFSYRGMTVKE